MLPEISVFEIESSSIESENLGNKPDIEVEETSKLTSVVKDEKSVGVVPTIEVAPNCRT